MTNEWPAEREELLGRQISDIGLAIQGTRVEALTTELYRELEARAAYAFARRSTSATNGAVPVGRP